MLYLEFARRERGLSLYMLSQRARISHHFISLVEHGRGIPTIEQLDRLSQVLDVPAGALLQPIIPAVDVTNTEAAL